MDVLKNINFILKSMEYIEEVYLSYSNKNKIFKKSLSFNTLD
jgi:hypothetical protein